MKCFKCGKEMDREDGGLTIKGITVTMTLDESATPETIKYNNEQLGKYSDGKGGCKVGTCYECYIDAVFNSIVGDLK